MHRRTLALAALIAPAAAQVHHGWGSCDAQNPRTPTGPVKAAKCVNPHVHVGIETGGAMWELTLAPPFRMQARGAERDILAEDNQVTAHGYVSRVRERELRAEWIEIDSRRFMLR